MQPDLELVFKDCGFVKDVDQKSRRIKALISGPKVDRQGEIVDPDHLAACMPRFVERGIISFMHLWWSGASIGRPTKDWGQDGDGIWNVARIGTGFQFATILGKMSVDDVWMQLEQGILPAVSIGGMGKTKPQEEDYAGPRVVLMSDLYEWAVCPIGAYREAHVMEVMRAAGIWPKNECTACGDAARERQEQALGKLSVEQLSTLFENTRRNIGSEMLSMMTTADLLRSIEKRLGAL